MTPRRALGLLAAAVCAAFCSGCSVGAPEGAVPVTGFELERYLGVWHEVARLDHRFERGLTQVTAEYSLRPDGGVKVLNRGFKAAKSEWKEAEGRAYFTGDKGTGQLKVSFFGPFYGGYNIIDLDKDGYRYALVCGPSRSYLWILAREPELPEADLKRLLDKAASLGFDTGALVYPGRK
jgi:apolipoprotein D and lipocalin family protein